MNFKDFKKVIIENIEADKNELKIFINKELTKLPVPTVEVNKNTYIERAVQISRNHKEFKLNRLSYIPDAQKQKAREGRFNNDKEPIFYAAFTDIESPESTRYFLATELDHSLLENQDKSFNITITKWLSTESFSSIFLLFKNEYCTNRLTKAALAGIKNREEFKKLTKEDLEFFELITEEIAKTESANNYIITNIIFDFYKERGYKSIIYPGVRSKYRGNNIAILPSVIDNNWNCEFGTEFKVTQHYNNINIEAVYYIDINENKLTYREIDDKEIVGETTIER